MSEPVTWMEIEHGGFTEVKVWREPVSKKSIPLYTQPMRELTDEEIEEVAKPYCDLQNWVVDKHEFARAILRKAQEK
jgi:hypothetical protein